MDKMQTRRKSKFLYIFRRNTARPKNKKYRICGLSRQQTMHIGVSWVDSHCSRYTLSMETVCGIHLPDYRVLQNKHRNKKD